MATIFKAIAAYLERRKERTVVRAPRHRAEGEERAVNPFWDFLADGRERQDRMEERIALYTAKGRVKLHRLGVSQWGRDFQSVLAGLA